MQVGMSLGCLLFFTKKKKKLDYKMVFFEKGLYKSWKSRNAALSIVQCYGGLQSFWRSEDTFTCTVRVLAFAKKEWQGASSNLFASSFSEEALLCKRVFQKPCHPSRAKPIWVTGHSKVGWGFHVYYWGVYVDEFSITYPNLAKGGGRCDKIRGFNDVIRAHWII